ncbi:LON peptidase substrate-binding domain-containing protein, partial [Mesorhizobium sp.]|uniref:LON peptidase substrate-binding domain-containing protein n=1 Tax=Mesorhizobium sp. TaxID=1871066 RepID=UPI000FE48602
ARLRESPFDSDSIHPALADTLAPLLSISIEQKQQLLETSDVVARLEKILDLMKAGRPENGPEPAG